MSEWEHHLAAQLNEGMFDSSGGFTLDVAQESARLRPLLAREPALFLLKGVQAAVALKCCQVTIEIASGSVALGFPAPHVEARDMTLGDVLNSPGNSVPRQYLRLMILSAVASGADVEVDWFGGTRWCLRRGILGQGREAFRLSLRYPTSPWRRLWDGGRRAILTRRLLQRCALCPIPVKLGSQTINASGNVDHLVAAPKINWLEACGQKYRWLDEHWWLAERPGPGFGLTPPLDRPAYRTEPFEPLLEQNPAEAVCLLRTLHSPEPGRLKVIPMDSQKDRLSRRATQMVRSSSVCVLGMIHSRDFVDEQVVDYVSQVFALEGPMARVVSRKATPLLERWFGQSTDPGMADRLYGLQHGILLDPIEGGSAHGAMGVVMMEDADTDLGGLKPVLTDAIQEHWRWMEKTLKVSQQRLRPLMGSVAACEKARLPLSVRDRFRLLLGR